MPETLNTDTIGGPSQLKQGFGVYFGTDIYIYIRSIRGYRHEQNPFQCIVTKNRKRQQCARLKICFCLGANIHVETYIMSTCQLPDCMPKAKIS